MSETFDVTCPECGTVRQAKPEMIGKRGKCQCGARVNIALPLSDETPAMDDALPDLKVGSSSVSSRQRDRVARGRIALISFLTATCFTFGFWMHSSRQSQSNDKALSESILTTSLRGIGIEVSPDKAAINQWLKENTHQGEWEEVRWTPPRKVPGYSVRVAAIKIRTETLFGKMLHEFFFTQEEGGEWEQFKIEAAIPIDSAYPQTLRKVYAIVKSIAPDKITDIDRYSTNRRLTQHTIRYVLEPEAEGASEPPESMGKAVLEAFSK